jgi:hypothetical protein
MVSSVNCCAIASYDDHDRAGVRVTLARTANDGVVGEGDDVRTSGVIGSDTADVITGDAGANVLIGSGGADVLDGGDGDDSIDTTLQHAQPADGADGLDSVRCGVGNDDVVADEDDKVGVDCERTRVGVSGSPQLVVDMGAARVDPKGSVALTYRVEFVNPDNALTSSSTFRLVDGKGRPASSTVQFVLGGNVNVARLRVKLRSAARRRLARSRSGVLPLIAQRVSRDASLGSTALGYEQFNAPVTIRRGNKH